MQRRQNGFLLCSLDHLQPHLVLKPSSTDGTIGVAFILARLGISDFPLETLSSNRADISGN
jgi:hypothetical protein